MTLLAPIATPDELVAAQLEYVELCAQILDEGDFQTIGQRRYKKKSAWRKIAQAYGIGCTLGAREYTRDDTGRVVRAEVIDRATAAGRTMEGIGVCAVWEKCCTRPCWKARRFDDHECCGADCDGARHFGHAEHDITGTAATRARNRAVADLIGFGEVSAEEIAGDGELVEAAAHVHEPVGAPNAESPWLDVFGNPAGWIDQRSKKRSNRSPDFRATDDNPLWCDKGTRNDKPAPMALWSDAAPEGWLELIHLRDAGLLTVEHLSMLDDLVEDVERHAPRALRKWSKDELADELARLTEEPRLAGNALARTRKKDLLARVEAARATGTSDGVGEPRVSPATQGSDGPGSGSPAPAGDVCALCGAVEDIIRPNPEGPVLCTDPDACMARVEDAALETVGAS